jgi:hypothetical protein
MDFFIVIQILHVSLGLLLTNYCRFVVYFLAEYFKFMQIEFSPESIILA